MAKAIKSNVYCFLIHRGREGRKAGVAFLAFPDSVQSSLGKAKEEREREARKAASTFYRHDKANKFCNLTYIWQTDY